MFSRRRWAAALSAAILSAGLFSHPGVSKAAEPMADLDQKIHNEEDPKP